MSWCNFSSTLVSSLNHYTTAQKLTKASGPNATTFIVPGECFPTRYRSTSHGISAASGKIGSIIAQAAIAPLRTRGALPGATTPLGQNPWLNHVMQIYSAFMFAGIFSTLLIPETKRKTLEDLAGEYAMSAEDLAVEQMAAGKDVPAAKEGSIVEKTSDRSA